MHYYDEIIREEMEDTLEQREECPKPIPSLEQMEQIGTYRNKKRTSIQAPSRPKTVSKARPSKGLVGEYVVGYRCSDVRNNLFFTGRQEVVYPTAALGVVLNFSKNT